MFFHIRNHKDTILDFYKTSMPCVILAVVLVFGNVMKHRDTFRVKLVSYIMVKFDDSSALLFLQENPIYTSKYKKCFYHRCSRES